jgi:hypothetical protein
MILDRDEHLVLNFLGEVGPHKVERICAGHKAALDKLIGWRLAALTDVDRVALTQRGWALLRRLGPWEPGND